MRTALLFASAVLLLDGRTLSEKAYSQQPVMKASCLAKAFGVGKGDEQYSVTHSISVTASDSTTTQTESGSAQAAASAAGGENPLSWGFAWGTCHIANNAVTTTANASASTKTYQRVVLQPGVDPASVPLWTPIELKYRAGHQISVDGRASYGVSMAVEAYGTNGHFEYLFAQQYYPDWETPSVTETFEGIQRWSEYNGHWIMLNTAVVLGGVAAPGLNESAEFQLVASADPYIVIDPAFPYKDLLAIETITVPVPEPSTVVIAASCLWGLVGIRRRLSVRYSSPALQEIPCRR